MPRLLLTPQALAEFATLPPAEQIFVRHELGQLASGRASGIRLWGQDELYTLETFSGTRFLYRVIGDELQVLGIDGSAAVPAPSPRLHLAAVVLAAGHDGYSDTLSLSGLADSFLGAGIDDIIMVVGGHADIARRELKHKDVTLVVNPEYDDCISRSLRYGLRMLSPGTRAVMLSPGNRPFITADIVTRLIRAFKTHTSTVVVPSHAQMRGHPVLFDTRLVPELMRAHGSCGGRAVLAHHGNELTQIDIDDAGVLERVWTN